MFTKELCGITREQLVSIFGNRTLRDCGFSVMKILQRLYPEYEWLPWFFPEHQRSTFWSNKNNCNKFFSHLRLQFGIESEEEWIRYIPNMESEVPTELLNQYEGNLLIALQEQFREYDWISIRRQLKRLSDIFHCSKEKNEKKEKKEKLEWIAFMHHIQHKKQWYNFTANYLRRNGASNLLSTVLFFLFLLPSSFFFFFFFF
jgi:hypothetical protein